MMMLEPNVSLARKYAAPQPEEGNNDHKTRTLSPQPIAEALRPTRHRKLRRVQHPEFTVRHFLLLRLSPGPTSPRVREEELALQPPYCTQPAQLFEYHLQMAGGFRSEELIAAPEEETETNVNFTTKTE
jgi:hypothetical protein